MKKILFYYLAFIIWILKIMLFITIIGIPIERILSDHFDLWGEPFNWALWNS